MKVMLIKRDEGFALKGVLFKILNLGFAREIQMIISKIKNILKYLYIEKFSSFAWAARKVLLFAGNLASMVARQIAFKLSKTLSMDRHLGSERKPWLGGVISLYCFLFLVFSPLYAPPVVVPNLNTPVFNPTSLDQTFNVAGGMQTVGNWDSFVFQGVSILQTQWEAQVQAQITMMVNSVTTSRSLRFCSGIS
ncbi:hypothetical protein LEP1GSC035_4381, partial [Leptospira noguchii str. 2007001578]